MQKPNHWIVEHVLKSVAANAAWLIIGAILAGVGLLALWLWGWLAETIEISRWHFWLAILVGPIIGFLVCACIVRIQRNREDKALRDAQLAHTMYCEDRFWGIRWCWDWWPNGELSRSSFTAYCPHCDRILSLEERAYGDEMYFICGACNKSLRLQGRWEKIKERIVAEIDLNMRKRANESKNVA